MKIGIDIMGGDFAPQATVAGTLLARKELPKEVTIVLFGDENIAKEIIRNSNESLDGLEFVHCSQIIGMGEHPAKAFSAKPDSSIAVGFKYLLKNEIQGLASAGSTGAMLVGAMFTVKSVPGIIRPAISAIIGRPDGKISILLDVGLNPDCKPDVLYQYGIIGSVYAEQVFGVKNPKVALLNIGEEKEKGNLLTKATYESMQDSKDFDFVGNIEGNDIYTGTKADVIVCDGFVGNVVLKQTESMYKLLKIRSIEDDYFNKFDFTTYGGTPILGINANVIIGHGVSDKIAIKNMLLNTNEVINANLPKRFKEIFA